MQLINSHDQIRRFVFYLPLESVMYRFATATNFNAFQIPTKLRYYNCKRGRERVSLVMQEFGSPIFTYNWNSATIVCIQRKYCFNTKQLSIFICAVWFNNQLIANGRQVVAQILKRFISWQHCNSYDQGTTQKCYKEVQIRILKQECQWSNPFLKYNEKGKCCQFYGHYRFAVEFEIRYLMNRRISVFKLENFLRATS